MEKGYSYCQHLKVVVVVGWLVDLRPGNTLVYLSNGSAPTIFTCCHTEIEVVDQTLVT